MSIWSEELGDEPPVVVFPVPPLTTLISDWENAKRIPDLVREDLRDTDRCFHYKLYNAFGATARRVVHSICAERGAFEHNSLEVQINDVLDRKIISKEVADRMHVLRRLGRNGAHPEWEEVTPEMAKTGINLLFWIIEEVYRIDVPSLPDWTHKKRYRLPKKPKPSVI